MKISVIVPCYNVEHKIDSCIRSLNEQTLDKSKFEVIIVDDCSSDNTYSYLENKIINDNYKLLKLEKNSGSPSRPRNIGLENSKGEYIFYLDADDELYPDTLEKYLNFAELHDYDLLRGYLIVDDGTKKTLFNKIEGDLNNLKKVELASKLISSQSTTVCQLIKRSVLVENYIKWHEDIRMGEDTLFLLSVIKFSKNIGYIDHPTFIYNKKYDGLAKSSTQKYGRKELHNHIYVWENAERLTNSIGLSYYKLRLFIGLKSAIENMLKYYQHDLIEDDFLRFSNFLNSVISKINVDKFNERFKDLINCILDGNFEEFLEKLKPRLLIAGYDLKFIIPAIPFLEKYYVINVDEWAGHEIHDVEKSKKLLEWADIIWCEWLLGNAVWYANNKLQHQKLVVRVHRFELTTKYIKLLDYSKVDIFFTVSVYFYEKFIEKTSVDRSKVRLLSNYLILEKYQKYDQPDKLFNIAMIGILPSRKGYYNGLLVLKELIQNNLKYKLHIYGKHPTELSWILNNKDQMEYYNKCNKFIQDNNMSEYVILHGWADIPKEIGKIGYILSVSDDEEIPESFHLAPAEAFAAGNIGLFLPWRGVEYIYPKKYILNDINEITSYIVEKNKNYDDFKQNSKDGYTFVKENYSIEKFIENVRNFLV